MSKKSRRRIVTVRQVPAVQEAGVRKMAEKLADLTILRNRENIPEKPTRSYDVSATVGLMAALGAMGIAEEHIEGRLKSIKNGFRDWRAAISALNRTVDRILASMPLEKAESLLRMKDDMGFKTFLNGQAANREPGLAVIRMDDLDAIICAAHEYCKMCDGCCDACRLGKALDHSVPETRERGQSWMMMDVGDFTPGRKRDVGNC